MRILTTTHLPHVAQAGGYRNWIASLVLHRWGAMPDWNTDGEARPAFILRGQWTVACDVCLEQVIYEPGEPFFCPSCCNARNGNHARPVAMPHNRAAIEALLVKRADPQTRNWWPDRAIRNLKTGGWYAGQTFRELMHEQQERGEL